MQYIHWGEGTVSVRRDFVALKAFQEILATGLRPRPLPSSGGSSRPVASANWSYSSNVNSYFPNRKDAIRTPSRCGSSLGSQQRIQCGHNLSSALQTRSKSQPMVKIPSSMRTRSGAQILPSLASSSDRACAGVQPMECSHQLPVPSSDRDGSDRTSRSARVVQISGCQLTRGFWRGNLERTRIRAKVNRPECLIFWPY